MQMHLISLSRRKLSTPSYLNLLHCVDDLKTLLQEIKRTLTENGNSALTTLVKGDRWSNLYLELLRRSGALVSRNPEQLLSVFKEVKMQVALQVKGNLAFINYR
jgi:hypothetical protein